MTEEQISAYAVLPYLEGIPRFLVAANAQHNFYNLATTEEEKKNVLDISNTFRVQMINTHHDFKWVIRITTNKNSSVSWIYIVDTKGREVVLNYERIVSIIKYPTEAKVSFED